MANRADSREVGMTCKDCEESALRLHFGFMASCNGCVIRAVARSPEFWEAVKTKNQHSKYRALLKKTKVTHGEARQAALNDRMCDQMMTRKQ